MSAKSPTDFCPHADRIPGVPCAMRECHARPPLLARTLVMADGRRFASRVRVHVFPDGSKGFHFFHVEVSA